MMKGSVTMSIERARAYLKEFGMEERIMELTESSATVELAAEALHCEPERIAKTLSFLVGEQPILIVAAGDARIDNHKYKTTFGTKAKMIPKVVLYLLMALAHQIGEDRCTIFSQDISEKSSEMLRLNLILNNLSGSLPNVVQGNTLTEPYHKEENGALRKFDFVVSNPPFNLDFSDFRDTLASDTVRFWAGVPSAPPKEKEKMSIYLCFIQHLINSLKTNGKGAIVIPTGFITSKKKSKPIQYNILKRIVDEHWIYGCISMPSNVFANTGTNVSVLFFDKAASAEKVILIDASKLGEEYKEGKNKKRRLLNDDIDLIVNTFKNKKAVENFSVAVSYAEIKEKGYSLSAGQYFDIKIDYVDITEEEFNNRMANYKAELSRQFAESHRLEEEIMKQLDALHFNVNVGRNE